MLREAIRHYPLLRGRVWLRRLVARRPAGSVVRLQDGGLVRLLDDPMFWDVDAFGEYEPVQSAVYRSLVAAGDVVIDVGANFGWYSTLLGRRVGPLGAVYAFEPVPTIAQLARDMHDLNGLPWVELVPSGLGRAPGEFLVHTFEGLPIGHASAVSFDRTDAHPHTCRLTTLDLFVAERGLARVDFVKMDVEGFEPDVLDGATETLRKFRPIVAFEVNERCLEARGLDGERSRQILAEAGYEVFVAIDRPPAVVSGPLPRHNADYVAVHPSRLSSLGGTAGLLSTLRAAVGPRFWLSKRPEP